MYDRLLIPTDGSEDMDTIAEHGITIASQFDAEVHVLHVVDDRAYASIPEDERDRVRETLKEDGHDATKAIATRVLDDGLSVTREIRWGNPPASVLSYAIEHAVDLIVMGTHGRTGYDRYLLGSVAEKVVRAAPVPVLTVHVGGQSSDVAPEITIPETDLSDSDGRD